MNSPLGMLRDLIRKIPYVKEYYTSDHGDSCLDHIGMSFIFALISIICGMLYTPLYWFYLASWGYHAIVIELVIDTWIKKKNGSLIPIQVKIIQNVAIPTRHMYQINWNAVIAQVLERSIGHVICLPVLIWRLV